MACCPTGRIGPPAAPALPRRSPDRRAGLTAIPPGPRLDVEDMETQRAKSGSAIEPSAAAPATGGAADLPVLSVRLLGDLDLRLGDSPLPPLESARAESLLAFLLLHRKAAQPRQRLAFLLWADSTEPQARANLRHRRATLRRALPDSERFIDVTPRALQWRA